MPAGAWIGAVATLAIFVLSHIGITIWWASKVNTLLTIVQKDMSSIAGELKTAPGVYATKEDLAFRMGTMEKDHTALWKRIDALTDRLESAPG